MGVEGSPGRVESVERVEETLKDGEVAGVDTGGRIVFVSEGFEESSEYGMEVLRAFLLSGIFLVQVGDPLANGLEFFTHGISADRVVGRSRVTVAQSVDKQETDFGFLVRDITEGWICVDGLTELDPAAEGVVFGSLGLTRGRGRGDLQRSAESRGELTLSGSSKMVQG